MTHKSAVLGCGPRSKHHAAAYGQITRSKLAACCDMNKERLQAYADEFGIDKRYTDLDEMLEKEKPDVVHIITPPAIRVPLLTQMSDAGVPGVIVEKPICIGADDYKALRALSENSKTKMAVNHQLRHHPTILEFLDDVANGAIGEVRFLDASAVLPMSGQGVHVLDLMFAFAGYAEIETVFGASSGYEDLRGTHPSPRTAETLITFRNGMRGALQAGEGAPIFDKSAPNWGHKRIAVYGTHGFRHWWMQGWEKSRPDGTVERAKKDYGAEDIAGQAGLTHAMFDWLEDENRPSPTNLKTSLDEWLVILAGYMSTVEARPVDLPFEPPDDLLDRFKAFVGAGGERRIAGRG
ncbi:MAG: Gfo/Idh/MocA family oxidoreductase [Kiritimatiellae bacterium]|nr:Gfo/Idh/MocA family oxidoreductase [Kiritimatiellia bacterium]